MTEVEQVHFDAALPGEHCLEMITAASGGMELDDVVGAAPGDGASRSEQTLLSR